MQLFIYAWIFTIFSAFDFFGFDHGTIKITTSQYSKSDILFSIYSLCNSLDFNVNRAK